ncbi:hypothetical protein NMB32_22145 [Stenotrophomonas sp. CD2]|nr:hypothetical protein NMB32_22145 [Stenotrophomonas sp. CD2]
MALFGELIALAPEVPYLHYMRGLAHKYLRDWAASLQDNLQSEQLRGEFDVATARNAGIAATGADDWAEARRQWARCGITLPEGEGPIEGHFGVACVRLAPWSDAEVVYMSRIDPVRARIDNVPLPESGFRFGDIVLHDGASTGQRAYGERRCRCSTRCSACRHRTWRPSPCSCSAIRPMTSLPWRPSPCPASAWSRIGQPPCAGCAVAAATARRTSMVMRRQMKTNGDANVTSAWPHRAGLRWKSSWRCGSLQPPAGCWRPSNSASTR